MCKFIEDAVLSHKLVSPEPPRLDVTDEEILEAIRDPGTPDIWYYLHGVTLLHYNRVLLNRMEALYGQSK